MGVAFVVGGCVSVGSYPARWAPPNQYARTCAELAGTYSNLGERADSTAKEPRIAYLAEILSLKRRSNVYNSAPTTLEELRARNKSTVEQANQFRVRIEVESENVVRVFLLKSAPDGNEILGDEPEKAPMCDGGKLTWSRKGVLGERGDPIVGAHSDSYEISRGSDGYLYVHSSEGAAGLAYLFFPVEGYESGWMRFAPTQ